MKRAAMLIRKSRFVKRNHCKSMLLSSSIGLGANTTTRVCIYLFNIFVLVDINLALGNKTTYG